MESTVSFVLHTDAIYDLLAITHRVIFVNRSEERFEKERMSTAYQFFEAAKKVVKLEPKCWLKKPKPPFEATGYQMYYVAADEADEQGKLDIMLTLDRTQKWNCKPLNGLKSCYEFIGIVPTYDGKQQIAMRFLPCPCEHCVVFRFEMCLNRAIVENMTFEVMTAVAAVECEDTLAQPLNQYVVSVLKKFITDNEQRLPRKQTKANLIEHIMANLLEFVTDE